MTYRRRITRRDMRTPDLWFVGPLVSLLAFFAIVAGGIGATVAYYNADETHTACVVEGKESINKSDSHEYRVYTSCGNFVVEDEFWGGHFTASETYADMKEGETYDLKTHGWRVPFFSMFPNVYEVK